MCRSVVLLTSPREVLEGWVVVGIEGEVVARRVVKRETWARARAEERVPIRRVRGLVLGLVGGRVWCVDEDGG